MKRFVATLIASLLATFAVVASATERTPDLFAAVMTEAGAKCVAKHAQRTILCIVHATDSDTDDMATGAVTAAEGSGFALRGWTLMMVNSSDYVVSLPFRD